MMKQYTIESRTKWPNLIDFEQFQHASIQSLNVSLRSLDVILDRENKLGDEFDSVIVPFVVSRGYPYDPSTKSFYLSTQEEATFIALQLSSDTEMKPYVGTI